MAADSETEAAQPAEPLPCAPCRATGKLISGLGGTPHEVECPWCDGSGTYVPGHDAQAARRGDAQS
ncbi:MAG TPA: hypothetical protein VFB41_03155 [Solirubrobacteraceae bacterium]|nr:hypothetical protein [Solirubrobacteraceae bacterium]